MSLIALYDKMTRFVGKGEQCPLFTLPLAGLLTASHDGLLSKLGHYGLDVRTTR